ncbi:hypothetical protein ACHMW5_19355 [Azospirillum melinis]|uniref:hypothetical protein n=1 Tax=Azospirillum melinis TaxID=328839 RepID=UPI003757D652
MRWQRLSGSLLPLSPGAAIPARLPPSSARSRSADCLAVNPQGLVPVLLVEDGVLITQSLAITSS